MGLPEAVQGSNLRPQLLAIGDVLPLGHGGLDVTSLSPTCDVDTPYNNDDSTPPYELLADRRSTL